MLFHRKRRPSHRPLHRFTLASTAMVTGAGLALVAAPTPARAAPLPAPYSGEAHADLVNLTADLAGQSIADAYVGHSRVVVDSEGGLTATETGDPVDPAKRVRAESSNVDVQLFTDVPGIPNIQPDHLVAQAPASEDPPPETLLPVPLAPLADVGLIQGDVADSTPPTTPA